MSLKLQEAITSIYSMTTDELNQVVMAVKQRRQFLNVNSIRALRIGDTVSFDNRHRVIVGTVQKVNTKNVLVKQDGTHTVWRVPANMLKPVKVLNN
jgi:hypothetical protein